MLTTIRIEYKNETISLALYEGIEAEELISVITSSFHITESIIGLRDSNGIIFLPKFICQNVSNIQRTSYDLLVKGQKSSLSITIPKLPEHRSTQNIITKEENNLIDTLRFLRMDGFLNKSEEKKLLDMFDKGSSDMIGILHDYKLNGDFQNLKESLKQLAGRSQPQIYRKEIIRPRTDAGYRSRRPLSAARLTESANINSTQAMLIGAVHGLEKKNLLDEQVVCIIKTLILEENTEVIKLLNSYIAHIIDERELCPRLQRLSERMSTYIERPSSPLPRKNSLLEFVSNIISAYIRDRGDVELLQKLIEYENEFVLSAFDVFESDQDQENLLDTLLKIIAKFKRMGVNKDSVSAAGFYDGGILQPEIPRPMETRGKARRSRPFTIETDIRAEFPLNEGSSEEIEEVNLPDAGLVYVTRGKKTEPKQVVDSYSFEEFKETGALDELSDELIGVLKWALMNEETVLKEAYNIWKVTSDKKLLGSILKSVCTKLFETALKDNLSNEKIELYKRTKGAKVKKLTENLRKTGNLMEFIKEIGKLANEPKKAIAKVKVPLEDTKNEEGESELINDILAALEADGIISKSDSNMVSKLYKKGNKEVANAFQVFKQDHNFDLLGKNLLNIISSTQDNTAHNPKTFEECAKYFKVHYFITSRTKESWMRRVKRI